jgi:hypothetical protein
MNGTTRVRTGTGWRGATPEIVIALVLVFAVGAAGYAVAGAAAPGIVAIGAAVTALVAFRGMLPAAVAALPDGPDPADSRGTASFTGIWRKRGGVADGTKSMTSYDAGLRLTLQHLLAARLAERHGISLREEPELARRLLCQGDRDDGLWYWVDPARPAGSASVQPASQPGGRAGRRAAGPPGRVPGIPPRTLARLIDRLERL